MNAAAKPSALLLGARKGLSLAVAVGVYGAAFGVLSRQAGLSLTESMAMSSLVFAGASQFVALDMWNIVSGAIPLITMALVVNLRHVLMGAAIAGWLKHLQWYKRLGALFFMVDESWALTVTADVKPEHKADYLIGSGMAMFVCWNAATIAGASLVPDIGDPARYGIDFTFCAAFMALLAGSWRGLSDLPVWLSSAAAALIMAQLAPGKWYIMAGGIAGGLAGALAWKPESGQTEGALGESSAISEEVA